MYPNTIIIKRVISTQKKKKKHTHTHTHTHTQTKKTLKKKKKIIWISLIRYLN